MNKYSMTCSCGDPMDVEAGSLEEAVSKMKEMMTEEVIAKHMSEKHPGEEVPSVQQVHAMVDSGTHQV